MGKPLLALVLLLVALVLPGGPAYGQFGGPVWPGQSGRPTYVASIANIGGGSNRVVTVHAEANLGIKVIRVCFGSVSPTAGVATHAILQRRTAAGSGGTLATDSAALGALSIARLNTASPVFGGVVRLDGTPGTAGTIVDQWSALTPSTPATIGWPYCHDYGQNGEQVPTVPAGVANGISLEVTAAGAGGLINESIKIVFIAEN